MGEERKIHPPGHRIGLCDIGHTVLGGIGAWEQPGARLQEAGRQTWRRMGQEVAGTSLSGGPVMAW